MSSSQKPVFKIKIDPPDDDKDIDAPKSNLKTPPISPRKPKPPSTRKPEGTKMRGRKFFPAKTSKPTAETARRHPSNKSLASPGNLSARTPGRSPGTDSARKSMTFFQPIDLNTKIPISASAPPKSKPPHSARKALKLLGADEKDTDNILKRRNFKSPVVSFYDPGWVASKKFFGHIGIKVFYDQANSEPNLKYYSYGCNGSSNESAEENDLISYKVPGNVLKHYKLALHKPHYIRDEMMANACQVINNKPRNKENSPAALKKDLYHETDNNCLHAVMEFLKNSGYPIKDSKKNTLPSSGMNYLLTLNLEWIHETRKIIINTAPADDKVAIQHMKDLLRNDMERLETEMVSANINSKANDEINCKLEIIILSKVLEKLNRHPIQFEALFERLCSMVTHNPKTNNQKKLLDCLNKFPVAQLADLNKKKEFLAEFVQEIIKNNQSVKNRPVPMEVRAWARNVSEKKLDKLSPLEIHRLTYYVKHALQEQASENKWFAEANSWLGKLNPAAKVAVPKTPRPFK